MSGSNISLEELLALLCQYGCVDLRFQKNAVSGWSGRTLQPFWTCELSLPGYQDTGFSRQRIETKADCAIAAAQACLDGFEVFIHGPEGAAARERYEDSHRVAVQRYARASTYERMHGHDPVRPAQPFVPPLKWIAS